MQSMSFRAEEVHTRGLESGWRTDDKYEYLLGAVDVVAAFAQQVREDQGRTLNRYLTLFPSFFRCPREILPPRCHGYISHMSVGKFE